MGVLTLIDLDKWLQKKVEIIYFPVYEFLLSLHVLARPEHHLSRYKWAINQLDQLPASTKKELKYYKSLTTEYLNIMDAIKPWDNYASLSVESGLERIEQLSIEDFILVLLGSEFEKRKLDQWMKGIYDNEFKELKPEFKKLVKEPDRTKKELLDFFYSYLKHFKKEQKRIEPWLIKAVHETQAKLNEEPVSFFKNIHPRLIVTNDYLQFHKAKTYQFNYHDLKRIYIKPSAFIEPHLLLGIYDDKISVGLKINVPSNDLKTAIPQDFIKIMKALSDPTRVGILKVLLEHSFCIQQLADMFNISEAAVSKHLRVLNDVDLIWSERQGYYVFYKGIPERLDMLTVEIHQFIDMKNLFNQKGRD